MQSLQDSAALPGSATPPCPLRCKEPPLAAGRVLWPHLGEGRHPCSRLALGAELQGILGRVGMGFSVGTGEGPR